MTRTALVTGAARNIGAAIAKRLTADGFAVVGLDRIAPEHDAFAEFVECDLSDAAALGAVMDRVAATHQVTALVNNAGIVMPAPVESANPASIAAVTAVNITAPLIILQKVLPAMKAAGWGRVVNISSRVALGKEDRTAYAATKAGLHGVTKTWALELGTHGITVNAVGPGPIRTSLFDAVNPPGAPRTEAIIAKVPVERLGTPDDIADAVAFFTSERAGFVTGQVLYVCGGMTIGSV
ncbi:oxidoreductase [Stappia sp. 22II-S9-Z10]|nr:oxidoreductase [Stappia sp. 22II-S9-Z10]